MSHFLVIYDRDRRTAPRVEEIDDPEEAVARLFQVEDELRSDPDRGIVMLVADDEATIRQTHAHYFKSLDELLELVEV